MKFWWRFVLNYFLLSAPSLFVTAWLLDTFWPPKPYTGGNDMGAGMERFGQLMGYSVWLNLAASYVLAKYWVF